MPALPRMNRRTVFVSTMVAAVSLTGCDLDLRPGAGAPQPPAPDPADQRLVRAVVTDLDEAAALVRQVVADRPALGTSLLPVAEAHDAHRARLVTALRLEADAPSTVTPTPTTSPPRGRHGARRAVRRSERALLEATRQACLTAVDGNVARALAAIAASTLQLLGDEVGPPIVTDTGAATTDVPALQTALAAEYALVHAYGVLGARTSQATAPDLYTALQAAHQDHRARRDALVDFVTAVGADPTPAAASYAVPDEWNRAREIEPAAASLEESATAGMAALVAGSSGPVRAWALDALLTSASRQLTLGVAAATWPGAPELDV